MEITTKELEVLLSKLLERLKNDQIKSVSIEQDMYFTILTSDQYKIYDSVEPAIGSLYDDWSNLQEVIQDKHPFTYLDIEMVASILKAVGEEIVPSKE